MPPVGVGDGVDAQRVGVDVGVVVDQVVAVDDDVVSSLPVARSSTATGAVLATQLMSTVTWAESDPPLPSLIE